MSSGTRRIVAAATRAIVIAGSLDAQVIFWESVTSRSEEEAIEVEIELPRFYPESGLTFVIFTDLEKLVVDFTRESIVKAREELALHTLRVAGSPDNSKGFPFRRHTAVARATVTFADRRYVSFYLDLYRFTGGAHGSTLRHGFTYDAATGSRLGLGNLYGSLEASRDALIGRVAAAVSADPAAHFAYEAAEAREYIGNYDFYLEPGGLVLFFQQYEIAPYSTGIPELKSSDLAE